MFFTRVLLLVYVPFFAAGQQIREVVHTAIPLRNFNISVNSSLKTLCNVCSVHVHVCVAFQLCSYEMMSP